MKKYKCENCGLHYDNKEMAKKCYDWCKKNGTCNIDITKNSIEVKGGKKNEKNKNNN